ncbi:MAG TPA: BON domain-containing protein [Burkholderiales bacterium]|nr:BON domain-containing protein [Burkholderiales bacterium]
MKLFTLAAAVGLVFGIRHFLRSRKPPTRVRPVIGALAKKVRDSAEIPDNVDVSSRKGVVTLKGGPIPKEEVDRALAAVLAVPGVHEVRNYVELTSPA